MSRSRRLSQGRATQIWRTTASWKLKHQDVRVPGEKLEPEAVETRRIHHSRWRTSGKRWRPLRGKGWTTWTGLRGIQIARQGEMRNQNHWQRGRWKRLRKLVRRRIISWKRRQGEPRIHEVVVSGQRQPGSQKRVHGQRHSRPGDRVSENWNGRQEELGGREGRVKRGVPVE